MAKNERRKSDDSERLSLITSSAPFGVTEAYKTLRANLQFVCPHEGCKVICLTSSIANEGKSSSALNTALSVAETSSRVLFVDADMRASRVARDLGLRKGPGLADLLASQIDEEAVNTVIQRVDGRDNLDIITSGKVPPNPSELLASVRMHELLDICRGRYDYIIIDGTPVGIVSDILVLAPYIDGYVVVVRADQTTKYMLRDTIQSIQRVNGKVLGIVLNGLRTKGSSYGRYGRYGKYGKYGRYGGYYGSYGA